MDHAVWVPAFAGTTWGGIWARTLHDGLVRQPNRRDSATRAHRPVQIRRHRIRRTRRKDSDRPCPWPRPDRLDIGRATPAHPGRIGTPRGIRRPSPRGRTGRPHSRREGVLGAAAATLIRDAGAAARYRDGVRTGAGTVAR